MAKIFINEVKLENASEDLQTLLKARETQGAECGDTLANLMYDAIDWLKQGYHATLFNWEQVSMVLDIMEDCEIVDEGEGCFTLFPPKQSTFQKNEYKRGIK